MAQFSRQIVTTPLVIEGKPVTVRLIENPIIDDVLVAEAKLQAITIAGQIQSDPNRRVPRSIREFFIRLGVDF